MSTKGAAKSEADAESALGQVELDIVPSLGVGQQLVKLKGMSKSRKRVLKNGEQLAMEP